MKFYIKQKVFTIKDKFSITDESQNLLYQVKGKFMSITNKLDFMNNNEQVLLHANRKVLTFMPKYRIFNPKDEQVAMINRKFAFRPKFELEILGKYFNVEGSFFAHSFTITDHGEPVASIKKKIISWGDTYEIEILSQDNVELFLFVVIVIDQVVHERRRR